VSPVERIGLTSLHLIVNIHVAMKATQRLISTICVEQDLIKLT
jgi:hypothetical protein